MRAAGKKVDEDYANAKRKLTAFQVQTIVVIWWKERRPLDWWCCLCIKRWRNPCQVVLGKSVCCERKEMCILQIVDLTLLGECKEIGAGHASSFGHDNKDDYAFSASEGGSLCICYDGGTDRSSEVEWYWWSERPDPRDSRSIFVEPIFPRWLNCL